MASGSPQVLYSITNLRNSMTHQDLDVLPLPLVGPGGEAGSLKNIFFSDSGDPYIYDSSGVLLVLAHWREPGQAQWIPLLDTRRLERLKSGRKEESYWPVAVAGNKFHCVILKGGETEPYFPRPLLSEFDFDIPVSSDAFSKSKANGEAGDDEADGEENSAEKESARLEETFVRTSVLQSLSSDSVSSTRATHTQRAELARQDLEIDKVLLQLLNVECRQGEERGMKALEIAGLLRDRSGKMLEAARKIAERYGCLGLADRIGELAERRLLGVDGQAEEGEGEVL